MLAAEVYGLDEELSVGECPRCRLRFFLMVGTELDESPIRS